MGSKTDFCQRAAAAKRGEELELIVTETFPTDPYYIKGVPRRSIDIGQLFKVIEVCGNQLHLRGKVGDDYLLLSIPIAFVAGCMAEVIEMQAVVPEEKSGWQPIETVPRNVRVLMFSDLVGMFTGVFDSNTSYASASPTRWMPLPEVPK